jgi:competence protein ComEA
MFKVILGVLLFTMLTLIVFINIDPNLVTSSGQVSLTSEGFISAQLSGEVVTPGTYVIKTGGTLNELILLSGGLSQNADEKAFIKEITVKKAVHYYIAPLFDPSDVCGTTHLVKVNLNEANQEQLMTLSNIGSSLAQAIITYRQQQGPFTYIEEIMNVSGIGNSTYTRIKNYITLM